jgi:RNA polymerase sigma-70 factor (ECF subfamily)
MDPADDTLLKSFLRGQREALGDLARRYERPLLGLALGLLGREDLARDAVQETWVRVIRYGKSFNGTSSVKTWLYRIAINRCRDLRARGAIGLNGTHRAQTLPSSAGVPPVSDFPDVPSSTSPSESSTSEHSWLRSQLDSMKPDHRLTLLLCYHEGITHDQAAAILDIPLGTLKSRLHAALTELRRRAAATSEARP